MMRKFTTALLVLLFLLLALPAMAQQDTNAKPPAATVDIQDYRLDNLEKQLGELTARQDAERVELETRLAEKLERETDRTAKWVEEAKDSLTTARTGLSNLLTGFSIIVSLLIAVVGLIGLFIGWRVWKKSDELHKKMDVELNNLEELTKKAAKYVEYIREYKRQLVEERAQSMTSDKTLTFKEREDIQEVIADETAPKPLRRKARALQADNAEEWQKALDLWIEVAAENPSGSDHFRLAYSAFKLAKTEGSDTKQLLELAAEHYDKSIKLDPQKASAHSNLGNTLIELAKLESEEKKRTTLLLQAEEAYIFAEELHPGLSSYNLACITALTGRKDECRHWLERCLEFGTIPSWNVLETDSDLDSVRREKWFKKIERSPYANIHGNSGVTDYKIGDDYICVTFRGGASYRYTYDSAGEDNIEKMKELAEEGRGLTTFISQKVRDKFASKSC